MLPAIPAAYYTYLTLFIIFGHGQLQIPAIKPLRLPLIEPNMLELLIISVFRSWDASLWIDVCPKYLVYQTELIQIPRHRARLVQDISQ